MIRFKKIETDIMAKIPVLAQGFKKVNAISAFYIFGSYARGKVKPLSDIDIAVLLKKSVPVKEYWQYKIDLLTTATRILQTEEIDFVVLNEAPYELAFQALKKGKLVFCKSLREKQEFQEKTVMCYLDTQHLRDEIFFHLKERIKTGRFAHDQGKYKKDIENVRRIFGEIRAHR